MNDPFDRALPQSKPEASRHEVSPPTQFHIRIEDFVLPSLNAAKIGPYKSAIERRNRRFSRGLPTSQRYKIGGQCLDRYGALNIRVGQNAPDLPNVIGNKLDDAYTALQIGVV